MLGVALTNVQNEDTYGKLFVLYSTINGLFVAVGFTIAIGCIFLYYITLPFFDLMAEKGVLHPFITAALPPIAFLLAIILFYKSREL